MTPVTFQLQLPPGEIERFERAMRLTPEEITAVAAAVVAQLKRDQMAQVAPMTVREFADKLGCTPSQVHALIRQGRLEAITPGGGDRRITAEAAARFFAAGGRNGAAP